MTTKLETSRNSAPSRSAASIRHLRKQIERLDVQICKLVKERASLAAEVGRVKNDQGTEVFSPAREEEVFKNVLDASKGPLDANTVRAIFREIMSGSRALQKVVKVAYLGPEYSFSHLAAVERCGQPVQFGPVGSISAVV